MQVGSTQAARSLRSFTVFRELGLIALSAKNADEIAARAAQVLENSFGGSPARIWLVQPDETLLLKASAGRFKHTDDDYWRTVDPKKHSFKIGRVAMDRTTYICNGIGDEFDPQWVKKEKLAAAAVLPLLNGDSLIGVSALFSRRQFGEYERQVLSASAPLLTMALEYAVLREERRGNERLAMLGQIAGSVAHDLRTPLARISTAIELLNEPLSESFEHGKYLEFISRAVRDMWETIESLLDYSRTSAAGRSVCDLGFLFHEVLSEIQIPSNIEVAVDLFDLEFPVLLNYSQMKRAFINLIKNAVDAMPAGGRLTIKGSRFNEGFSISVTDTGVGIAEADLKKIFTPLFTRSARGTGFGLAASRSIVEAHGGKLLAESEVGRGSAFTISLPFEEIC